MEGEELKFELRERLEDAYRLSPTAQIALYVFLEIIIISIIYSLNLPMKEAFVVFLFASTVLYPIVIKLRTLKTEIIAMALYGATIATIGLYIYDMLMTLEATGADQKIVLSNAFMAMIFLLVFGVELFHHVYERAKILRAKWVYLLDLVLTIIFAAIVFSLLSLWNFDLMWTLLLTALASLFYFVAIKPETPF